MNTQRGFSLIELTLMVAVGAVIFVGLGGAVQSLIHNATENRNTLVALNIAKQQMAILNNDTCPDVGTTNPDVDGDSGLFDGFTLTQTVTNCGVDCTSGSDVLNQVQLDVSASGKVLIELNTYCSNIVTFGNGT